MNERIKIIRCHFHLTQQEMADRLHIKRGAIANYETGRNVPVDSVVALLCREFNVSEEWLRDGTGEMFPPRSRPQEIAELANRLLHDLPENVRNVIVPNLLLLDVEDWEAIARILEKLSSQ